MLEVLKNEMQFNYLWRNQPWGPLSASNRRPPRVQIAAEPPFVIPRGYRSVSLTWLLDPELMYLLSGYCTERYEVIKIDDLLALPIEGTEEAEKLMMRDSEGKLHIFELTEGKNGTED